MKKIKIIFKTIKTLTTITIITYCICNMIVNNKYNNINNNVNHDPIINVVHDDEIDEQFLIDSWYTFY